jgi:molecular chaperone GrpE
MDSEDRLNEIEIEIPDDENSEGDSTIEKLNAQIEEYRAEAEDYKDKYLRLAAEFDNYKKRQNRVFDEMVSLAQDALLHRILSILDNFERALESTKDDVDRDTVIEGVELIHKQLLDMLEAEKVTEICPLGECFDPNVHEAVSVIPCDDDDKVVEVLQKGYKRGERLVRPARVIVGKAKDSDS